MDRKVQGTLRTSEKNAILRKDQFSTPVTKSRDKGKKKSSAYVGRKVAPQSEAKERKQTSQTRLSGTETRSREWNVNRNLGCPERLFEGANLLKKKPGGKRREERVEMNRQGKIGDALGKRKRDIGKQLRSPAAGNVGT